MKRVIILLLAIISFQVSAKKMESDKWIMQTHYNKNNEKVFSLFNKQSESGFYLQFVFNKNRDQCFSSMSLMALGYKDEEFKQDGLDCLILSGSGNKENVETVECSAYGSPNDSILIFMPKLGDDAIRRIHTAIEKKEDISFNVMRTEIKTKFKLDDPDGFISMSNNYCENG